MLLNFDKPQKVKIDAGFDGGPDGGYVPQMDKSDAERWKAKLFNAGKENARIELRKTFTGVNNGQGASQVFMIVSLDGWDLAAKHEQRSAMKKGYYMGTDTRGLNVRMSMNGPLLMTFDTFNEIDQIVNEAREHLLNTKETK